MDQSTLLNEALKYEQAMVCFAYGVLRDWGLARDAVQEAVVVLNEKHREYDPEKSLYLWFKQMVRYKVLNICRDRRREVYVEDEELQVLVNDALDEGVSPRDVELHEEHVAALLRCMAKLTTGMQDLLIAYYWKGMSCKTLARAWKRSAGALRVALSRVRQSLRKCMRQELGGVGMGVR